MVLPMVALAPDFERESAFHVVGQFAGIVAQFSVHPAFVRLAHDPFGWRHQCVYTRAEFTFGMLFQPAVFGAAVFFCLLLNLLSALLPALLSLRKSVVELLHQKR